MKKLATFLEKFRVRIFKYIDEKKPVFMPTLSWWVLMLALDRVATELADAGSRSQVLTTLLGQKTAQLKMFIVTLQGMCGIAGTHDKVSILKVDQSVTVWQWSCSANISNARVTLQDLGSFVLKFSHTMNAERVTSVERLITGLSSSLIYGLSGIVAPRNKTNEPKNCAAELTVFPHLLINIRTPEFCRLILKSKPRQLATGWTAPFIDLIMKDHRNLLRTYRSEPPFDSAFKRCTSAITCFDRGWAADNGRFERLCEFCGGFATVFRNKAPVEADFSDIAWEKNDYR